MLLNWQVTIPKKKIVILGGHVVLLSHSKVPVPQMIDFGGKLSTHLYIMELDKK